MKSTKSRKNVKKTQYGLKIPRGAEKYCQLDENGNEIWEIDKIMDMRETSEGLEYLVKWKGWGNQYNSWEPKSNFRDDDLDSYTRQYERRKRTKRIYKTNFDPPKYKQRKGTLKNSQDTKIIIKRMAIPQIVEAYPKSDTDLKNARTHNIVYQVESPVYNPNPAEDFITNQYRGNNYCSDSTYASHEESKLGLFNFNKNRNFASPVYHQAYRSNEFCSETESYLNSPKGGAEEIDFNQITQKLVEGSPLLSDSDQAATKPKNNEIVECWAYRGHSTSDLERMRFKVAVYDEENKLNFDFCDYNQMVEKKCEHMILSFFAREILYEMDRKQLNLTKNIKLI